MKHYEHNPRQITKKEFADLRDSLRKFGDLSGIVHNLNSDEIISGNQRMEVFDIKAAQIEIVERREEPDAQGTVATGWVHWQGSRYAYRAVMWDERQAKEANIRANKAGGSWDFDVLANAFDVPELIEGGFMPYQLGIPGDPNDPEAEWKGMPEFEQEDKTAYKTIHVHFDRQEDVDNFSKLVNQTITDKTNNIWFPYKQKADLKSKVYKSEP